MARPNGASWWWESNASVVGTATNAKQLMVWSEQQ